MPSWKIFATRAGKRLALNVQCRLTEGLVVELEVPSFNGYVVQQQGSVQGVSTLNTKSILGILLLSLVLLPLSSRAEKISGSIADQGDTAHFELAGQQNWNYDLRRADKTGKNVLQLTIDPVDENSLKKILGFQSELISKVAVDRSGPDGKYILSFTLANEDVESFDYLTDQPSRLIVDFYVSNHPKSVTGSTKGGDKTVAKEKSTDGSDAAKPAEKNKLAKTLPAKANTQRKPATTDVLVVKNDGPLMGNQGEVLRSGLFDGGDPDFERFSIKDYEVKDDALIRAHENYYIPYPMIQAESHYWEKMKIAPPVYEIRPQETEENKEARLLQTLFEKERYAVYLKTADWFEKKYPESQYNDILDFMTADVYKALWQQKDDPKFYDIAQVKYKQALERHPKSPLTERTSLMLGYMALEKADNLNAIRLFNEHIEKNYAGKADAVSNDLARIGTGIAFMRMNRFQEATDVFSKLEKSSPYKDIRAEAAYRGGDVYVLAKNYDKAIAEYQNAIKKYPEYQSEYPNAFYNQAEALFGMEKYRESLDVYKDFVKKFPSHEHAAFAMTRMGELLDILGADKSRVIGAYLETYFRYGESNNAIIARLRLTSARMKSMKPKEIDASVKEILDLVKKLDIPNSEQFGTIMISEGFNSRKDYGKAIDLLTKYYQQNPTTVDRELFKKRIVNNIADEIRDQVASGDFIKALKTHTRYADNWLKSGDRIDVQYSLAKAFEMAGAQAQAEKYYRDVLNRTYAVKGTPQEKQLISTHQKPNEDEVNLRLAETTFQEKKFNESYDYLKNMKNPEALPEDLQIERVRIAVDLLEKRGDLDSAVRYLTELLKTWKGQPQLVAEPYLRLAQLEVKQGKPDDAIESLKKVDVLMVDSKEVPVRVHEKSLELLGQLYIDKGASKEAIGVYDHLLRAYEDKIPLASIRYKLGQIYFKQGDLQKAAEIWNQLQGDKNQFWYQLAQEQLKNSEWRSEYKKYIQRIPAMAQ